jgi:hypothetical protein
MNILFLTTVLPAARSMGSEVASQLLIDELRALGHRVRVLGYVRNSSDLVPGHPDDRAVAVRAIETRDAGYRPIGWFATALARRLPYSAAKYCSGRFVTTVRTQLAHGDTDVVVIDHAQLAWLSRILPSACPVIFIAHNVEHEMYASLARQPGRRFWSRAAYQREARRIAALEREMTARADETWVFTEHDAMAFRAWASEGNVRTLGLPAPAPNRTDGIAKSCDVALIGSWTWQANLDGLQWFLQSVLPLLPAHLHVAVAGRGAEWVRSAYPRIDYRGFVPHAQDFLAAARAIAIPTLSGGGIQIKTLDAMASGSRIVATPPALRGIADAPPSVVIAEGAEAFAHALVDSLTPLPESATRQLAQWVNARATAFQRAVSAGLAACGHARGAPLAPALSQ